MLYFFIGKKNPIYVLFLGSNLVHKVPFYSCIILFKINKTIIIINLDIYIYMFNINKFLSFYS